MTLEEALEQVKGLETRLSAATAAKAAAEAEASAAKGAAAALAEMTPKLAAAEAKATGLDASVNAFKLQAEAGAKAIADLATAKADLAGQALTSELQVALARAGIQDDRMTGYLVGQFARDAEAASTAGKTPPTPAEWMVTAKAEGGAAVPFLTAAAATTPTPAAPAATTPAVPGAATPPAATAATPPAVTPGAPAATPPVVTPGAPEATPQVRVRMLGRDWSPPARTEAGAVAGVTETGGDFTPGSAVVRATTDPAGWLKSQGLAMKPDGPLARKLGIAKAAAE